MDGFFDCSHSYGGLISSFLHPMYILGIRTSFCERRIPNTMPRGFGVHQGGHLLSSFSHSNMWSGRHKIRYLCQHHQWGTNFSSCSFLPFSFSIVSFFFSSWRGHPCRRHLKGLLVRLGAGLDRIWHRQLAPEIGRRKLRRREVGGKFGLYPPPLGGRVVTGRV